MAGAPANELLRFLQKVADTGYDGRPCSHEDGCHDAGLCTAGDDYCGDHCDPWDVSNDEEHDALVDLVNEARQLLGLPDLYRGDCPCEGEDVFCGRQDETDEDYDPLDISDHNPDCPEPYLCAASGDPCPLDASTEGD